MRATTSVLPPGAKGTTIFTGLVGQAWAAHGRRERQGERAQCGREQHLQAHPLGELHRSVSWNVKGAVATRAGIM